MPHQANPIGADPWPSTVAALGSMAGRHAMARPARAQAAPRQPGSAARGEYCGLPEAHLVDWLGNLLR